MDSNDRERIGEAREELMRMLAEDELRDAVLLIFANKQVSDFGYQEKMRFPIADFRIEYFDESIIMAPSHWGWIG